jgi:transcriptional/translational regulatory protein YebC/TACO1
MDNKITCEQVQTLLDDYGLADLDDVRFVLDQYQKVICNCTKRLSKLTYDASTVIAEICDTQNERELDELMDATIEHNILDLKNKNISNNDIIVLYIPTDIYSITQVEFICRQLKREFPNQRIITIPKNCELQLNDRKVLIHNLEHLLDSLKN